MLHDVACYGTSLTQKYQWQADVSRRLRAAGITNRLYNFGRSGADSGWGAANVGPVLRARPLIALVEFSMNDAANMTVAQAEANTIAILDALKSVADAIYLVTMNPTVGAGDDAARRASLPDHYTMYRDLAVSEGAELIDIAPLWATAGLAEIPDGIHPTTEAHLAVTAPAIAAALIADLAVE